MEQERGYEVGDVRPWQAVVGAGVLFGALGVGLVVMGGYLRLEEKGQGAAAGGLGGVDGGAATREVGLGEERAREDAAFAGMGWEIDPSTGVRRVPDGVVETLKWRGP